MVLSPGIRICSNLWNCFTTSIVFALNFQYDLIINLLLVFFFFAYSRFHAKSHSKTCSGWLLHKNDHRNTEIAEQANSIFAGISNMLGRCGWIMGMFNIAVAVACFNKIRNIRYEQELKAKELEMQRLPTL